MKTSSCKAKGRRLQQKVAKFILDEFKELTERDVQSTSMGATGVDIKLSASAHKKIPFAIECKNQEANAKLIKEWEQAEGHCQSDENALLILSANKSKVVAVVSFPVLLTILRKLHEQNKV